MELGQYPQYNARLKRQTMPYFRLTDTERLRSIYCIGKIGVGKSTAMLNWAIKDIRAGRGCIFIDPHGHDAETLLSLIPTNRLTNVIYFAPHEFPIAFNLFDRVPKNRHAFVATSTVDTLKGIFDLDFTASNIEMFVNAATRVLLENPGSTLMGLNYLLTSPAYRNRMVSRVKDPIIRDFWKQTFDTHMTDKEQRDRTISTISKVFQLITDPALNNCLGQSDSAFSFEDIIANDKIFIASVPEGDLGIAQTKAIISFIVSRLHTAVIQRKSGELFPVYIDEFQYCSPMVLKAAFASWRKRRVALTLAHHYLSEVDDKLRDAIFGTAGTTVAFTVGPFDADLVARLFSSNIKPDDLIKQHPFRAYVAAQGRYLELSMPEIDGKPSRAMARRIRDWCRLIYSRPREEIEAEIAAFVASTAPKARKRKQREQRGEAEPAEWSD